MGRRAKWALALAFLVTRILGVWLATHPADYPAIVTGDLALYQDRAAAVLDRGGAFYASVPLEYPPGALPMILIPHAVSIEDATYTTKFVLLSLLVDAAGFVGLWRLVKRSRSSRGLWLWIGLLPSLGPIAYLRLDLLPAVATIWAVERAAASGWFGSGAALSFGAIAKIYPALLIPASLWSTPRSRRIVFILGALWVAVPLVALGGSIDEVVRSVLGYHSTRSVQVESTWATALLIGMRWGSDAFLNVTHGSFHIDGGIVPAVRWVALLVSVAGVVGTTALVIRRVRPGDADGLAAGLFAILAVAMVTGLVFSPQFVVWPFALAAAALTSRTSRLGNELFLLVPIALLTQAIYPFNYGELLALESGAIFTLATRNVLMLTLAVLAVWRLATGTSPAAEGISRHKKA